MIRSRVAAFCASLPGATPPADGGPELNAWKIGGKLFACFSTIQTGVSVKTDSIERAQMLIEQGLAERAPYFHRSWVHLPPSVSDDDLHHRLRESYRLVRAGLPKKTQAALGPQE